ncbi:sensor histidine kinase [Paenibacillus alginolyticus]|uniref:Sensor histidine kinase n=1 Tax=Paenibacillus alginolyticus TaxID=59839 RepID=A0ABT4GGQ6_9BACL|nr:sensor histidine kinase [Paenibacillus alginolyticus]MCY9668422.1 sensor histidine kinase [Paenibacillus alginolyticus]MCY9695331.1 sensor histidine kinase [Paenibacillus alginolyticus]MEC0144777.1 sensor histidine kinase [Paenibacillus alginolyticus]
MKHNHLIQYINQHFKVKLILTLSVIIIVCSLITGYVSYRVNVNLFESEISKQYLKTSEQTIQQLGFKIQDMYRITDFVFFHPYVEQIVQEMSAEPAEGESGAYRNFLLERDLANILLPLKNETPHIRAVYLVDLQGYNMYYSQSNPSIQVTFPDFYEKVKNGRKDTSAELVWQRMKIPDSSEPSGEKSSLVAARWLKSTKTQTVYGMMILIIDEAFLGNSLDPLLAGRTSGAYIYDQFNRLLYSREPEGRPGIEPKLETKEATVIQHHNGDDYLFVKSVFEPRSFTLVSGISLAEIKAKGLSVYHLAIFSGFVSIILMAVSVSLFSGRMLKPLHVLVKAMQRVREGNLRVVIPKTSNDEFAFLAESFNKMVTDIQSLIQEVYVSKLSEKEAELKALQAQLNPHFLHNALNSIYWKIMLLYDDDETAALVTSLSELLRYSLATVTTPSTLRDELAQIRNYITIQEARHGEELYVHIEADETLAECQMQRLLIQPLVENVFVHAFQNQTVNKRLTIRALRKDANMLIEVEDNGCGMHPDTVMKLLADQNMYDGSRERESIGVRNVIRRIDLVHGEPYGLDIVRLPTGTLIQLMLPYNIDHTREGAMADDTNTAS